MALLLASAATATTMLYYVFLTQMDGTGDFKQSLPLIVDLFQSRLADFYGDYSNIEGVFYALMVILVFGSVFFVIYYIFYFFTTKGLREKRQLLQKAFSHYISPSVIQDILARPQGLVLGGKSAYLTVYFLDIEGFSEMMSEYHPKQIVKYLNEYFSEMAEIILKHEGTIDKYEGDAIMAFWGAPKMQEDHAVLACRSALEHQKAMKKIRTKWKKLKRPEFHGKIGIASGDMVVGNIGSKGHFNYTVIGRAVNGGVQIEKLNRIYETEILVGEKTYHKAKHDFEFREIDSVNLKGYKKNTRIFELLAPKGKLQNIKAELVSKYHEALNATREESWEEAQKAINHCLRIAPKDKPSQILKEKIAGNVVEKKKKNVKKLTTKKTSTKKTSKK